LRDLQRYFRYYHGVIFLNDSRGRSHLAILLGYLHLCGKQLALQIDLLAPWLKQDEADYLIQIALNTARLHKADELGAMIGLNYAVRQDLAITTIGAIDCSAEERERLRCDRRNANKRSRRALHRANDQPKRLKPRQTAVLEAIGDGELSVAEIVKKVAKRKEFRTIAVAQRVHETVNQLQGLGLVLVRKQDSTRAPIRLVRQLRHQQ
jgi:hypothetical protein